jgi:2-polyprenyl-3-methyl-5-hydroxy-6-metoxy-1,4-benzoquinol methylase
MANQNVECPLSGRTAALRISLSHTTVWQCNSKNCGLQFAHPQLSDEALSSAYSNLYYPGREAAQEPQFENTPKLTLRHLFRQLEKRIGSLRGLRLLDYGCGRGALLEVAKEFGMQFAGIEADPQARAVASSILDASIYSSIDHLRCVEPNARFDLIILWTVIEHLRTPWIELAQLRSLVQPAGWFLISTMDINCLRTRVERGKWENYENPTHLYYFDRVSLEQVIREAGFADYSEWRLKLIYPQHGTLRRWLYELFFFMGISDGLFFLCRRTNEDARERISSVDPETLGAPQGSGEYSTVPPQSRMKSRS